MALVVNIGGQIKYRRQSSLDTSELELPGGGELVKAKKPRLPMTFEILFGDSDKL